MEDPKDWPKGTLWVVLAIPVFLILVVALCQNYPSLLPKCEKPAKSDYSIWCDEPPADK